MIQNNSSYYQALAARDSRFDGVFFFGVTTTGIYCRPVCTAKTPKEAHCRFFENAALAEQAHFRPCLKCRPELAPGKAPVDDAERISHLIIESMEETLMNPEGNLDDVATRFQLSSRQIRRIVQKELGVSPVQLIQTRRLLLAKQLLTETMLTITQIAFASGFRSLRRFNDAFLKAYGFSPSRLRKNFKDGKIAADKDTSTLLLTYRPPYDWQGMLDFLRVRAMSGIESVTENAYSRTVRMGDTQGWIRVTHRPERHALQVEFVHTLLPNLPTLLAKIRNLFDLAARPDLINTHLSSDRTLRPLVKKNPGLRVPGSFDGFETAIRAILGQQVSVKAATTLSCRFAETFGQAYANAEEGLTHLSPLPEIIARAGIGDIAELGIVSARAKSIIGLAQAVIDGKIDFSAGQQPDAFIKALQDIPGIGPWTAHYMAMRILRWPDAFPKEDIALLNRLGHIKPAEAESMSQCWRPWRSYAVLHLWQMEPV